MTRWTLLALGVLCASLAAVILGAVRLIRDDRADIVAEFAEARLAQVQQAARFIEEDQDHVGQDLRFAGRLATDEDVDADHARELGALLTVVDEYRRIYVYSADGRPLIAAKDAGFDEGAAAPDFDRMMDESAAAASAAPPGTIQVTEPITTAGGWFRVFALALPRPSRSGAVAVAMLVDTAPLFRHLRLVALDPATHLLVVGPRGRTTPISDPALSSALSALATERPSLRAYAELFASMRAGGSGTQRVGRDEAERLGLGRADAVAAYASVPTGGDGRWAIAALSSTSQLEAHERVVVLRLGLASGLMVAVIVAFGVYLLVVARRATAVAERLKQADRLAHLHDKMEKILEVRSLTSQLLRAEKLATVGVLAAGIAHEIGTPLGVVRGRAEYVLGKLGAGHAQAGGIQVIVEQIDVITRTIRKLLDFSRVRPPAVQPVDVGAAARAVGELLRYEAERRKVSLEVDVPDGLSPVAANPDELQQALVNLVMNACDACSAGGQVRVTAASGGASAPGSEREARRRVRIEVEDDGHGIQEEHRAQVFDPFFTTKKRGQGTGLGLTIAAQIVRNHGGEIELDSEPGRGTRFTLLWPAAVAPAEPSPSSDPGRRNAAA